MAIEPGSLVNITVTTLSLNGLSLNSWDYEAAGTVAAVPPINIAEAWWNHVKAAYRGIYSTIYGPIFQSVRITELNNDAGAYAEYSIPLAERTGTRAGATGDAMPPFSAVGVRLTVGSRVTRPGQKRFGNLYEGDQVSGVLQSGIVNAVNSLMAVMTTGMVLGAPAAAAGLLPIVGRRDRATGFVVAHQEIEGWLVNTNVTTQNTRKFGRGI